MVACTRRVAATLLSTRRHLQNIAACLALHVDEAATRHSPEYPADLLADHDQPRADQLTTSLYQSSLILVSRSSELARIAICFDLDRLYSRVGRYLDRALDSALSACLAYEKADRDPNHCGWYRIGQQRRNRSGRQS